MSAVARARATIVSNRALFALLVPLAILAGLNRPNELFTRVVGLLRGGISVEQIQEVFLHIGFYCGNPAGVEATAALHDAMKNLHERGIAFRET